MSDLVKKALLTPGQRMSPPRALPPHLNGDVSRAELNPQRSSSHISADGSVQTPSRQSHTLEVPNAGLNVVEELQDSKILEDLFGLLVEFSRGDISAREFGNNTGSIRLKLAKIKDLINSIEGLDESVYYRATSIDQLKKDTETKKKLLHEFKEEILKTLND